MTYGASIWTNIAHAQVSVGGGAAAAASTAELQGIILNIYNLALLFGGLLAFVMILIAAVKYTLQPGNSSAQSDARDQITQAFFGLLLLLGAYVVLNTINPEIVNIKLPTLPKVEMPPPVTQVKDCSVNFMGAQDCRTDSDCAAVAGRPVCMSDCRGAFRCVSQTVAKPPPGQVLSKCKIGCEYPKTVCVNGGESRYWCAERISDQTRCNPPKGCPLGSVCVSGIGGPTCMVQGDQ